VRSCSRSSVAETGVSGPLQPALGLLCEGPSAITSRQAALQSRLNNRRHQETRSLSSGTPPLREVLRGRLRPFSWLCGRLKLGDAFGKGCDDVVLAAQFFRPGLQLPVAGLNHGFEVADLVAQSFHQVVIRCVLHRVLGRVL
jgi:hypothetical protein